MAVTIAPKTATIIPGLKPSGSKPIWMVNQDTKAEAIVFNPHATDGFTAIGKVTLTAGDGAELTGYTLGWIQMQLMETRWAIYRGDKETDGSFLVNHGWKPNYAACRDVGQDSKEILYDATYDKDAKNKNRFIVPQGTAKKIELVCELRDFPNNQFDLSGVNQNTKQVNYLAEGMVEYYFCSVLTLLQPDKTFQHLKHVYWSIGWHCTFTPKHQNKNGEPGIVPVKGYSHPGKACKVLDGGPSDVRIKDKLTDGEVVACNTRAQEREGLIDPFDKKSADINTKRHTRSLDESTESYDCFKK